MKHALHNIARQALDLIAALTLMLALGEALTSCDHPVSILDIEAESELVVYAFPTTDDDYLLTVSLTRPTAGHTDSLDLRNITCTTNGRPDQVTFLHYERHFHMPMAIYRVQGQHHSGDLISITVTDAHRHTAQATTTIPPSTPMQLTRVDTIQTDALRLRFLLHVTLPMAGTDGRPLAQAYYATRLTSEFDRDYDTVPDDYDYAYDDSPDEIYHTGNWSNYAPTTYNHLAIDPAYEPILNHYSDLNLDPWNEYYASLYYFTTDDLLDHLSPESLIHSGLDLHLQTDFTRWNSRIDVQFYTLSREYYLMLRHLNDQLSNELADVGLSQTYSTYSNVRGGFGCVAAYTCQHATHTPPERPTDPGIFYTPSPKPQ